MNGSDDDMMVSTPAFKWEWNLNTIVVLIGFAAGFVAWGYALNDLWTGRVMAADGIRRLDVRVDRMAEELRAIPNHELRITANERAITQGIGDMRSVTDTANELKSDVRVIREIVERIEGAQSRNGAARPARD